MTAIVALADVKDYLNLSAADTSHDAELQRFIEASTPVIENIVGPVINKTYTETYDGGESFIELRHRPVVSVTSVTEYRGSVSYTLTAQTTPATGGAYNYVADLDTGRVMRYSSGVETSFPAGRDSVTVVYISGEPSQIPANIVLGTLELIRHLYQQTQQGGRPRFPSSTAVEDSAAPPLGFAVPNRVRELLEPHRRAPSVA